MADIKKLIVSDIDGTLLTSGSEVSNFDMNMIRNAREHGAEFTISSGRVYSAMKYLIKLTGITVPVSCVNGGIIMEPETEKIIFESALEKSTIKKSFDILKQYDGYIYYYTQKAMIAEKFESAALYYDELNKTLPKDEQIDLKIVKDLYDLPDEKIYKIMKKDKQKRGYDEMKAQLSHVKGINYCSSWVDNIEIYSDKTSKGKSALIIADYLGVDIENVMVIGDEDNDIAMFETNAFKVAMGNAIEPIKARADYITDTNDNGGLGKAIDVFLRR